MSDADETTKKLAEFSSSIDFESLAPGVGHQAQRCLLDTLAAMIASSREQVPSLLIDYYRKEGGAEEATVVLSNLKIPSLNAALINGSMAHSLELDDGHRYAAGHPGAVVIPAALAAAELSGAGGKEVISGIAAGYEVFVRLGAAINPEHLRRGFHTTGTCGPFGAAAAAGRILGLGAAQMESAFGLAGLQGSGLLRVVESGAAAKPFQVGRASQSGLFAAILAMRGLDGPDKIIEGSKGFVGAMSGSGDYRSMVDGLGNEFRMLQTYVKPYPTCRHMHAAIECASSIRSENGIKVADIEDVSVSTYQVAIDLTGSINAPRSLSEARFSVSYAVAAALARDRFSQGFSNGLDDPEVMELARKVRVSNDKRWEDVFPKLRGCTVRVHMRDGSVFERSEESAKGEPERPLSDTELADKFMGCANGMMSEAKARDLIRQIMGLEKAPDISKLSTALA